MTQRHMISSAAATLLQTKLPLRWCRGQMHALVSAATQTPATGDVVRGATIVSYLMRGRERDARVSMDLKSTSSGCPPINASRVEPEGSW
mmetsp:Transcript_15199/g.40798  ORF Transcript_15199/g.40798 Transcript_15199/m.40798 type:complete len:90 (+) Transcript_15199:438-707(+)